VPLSIKLLALGITCYLGGLFVFSPKPEPTTTRTSSNRQVTDRKLQHRSPLHQSGASQIEGTLSFVAQLDSPDSPDSPDSCRNFAAQLNADPKNRHSKTLWSIILARWSQLDPDGMITFLQRHESTGDSAHDLKVYRDHSNHFGNSAHFFEKLSKESPLEAVALIEQDPPSQDRAISTVAVAVAKNWALTDPDASLA
jgi:hypothetical protein